MHRPELISRQNERVHLHRLHERRIEKELLRRNDRRKNFEAGESVGLLLAMGALAILAGWRGGLLGVNLVVWQRLTLALMGGLLLIVQYHLRKTFYQRTEAPLIGAQKRKQHVDDSRS